MRKNRNQCLVILLIFSLLTSMAPSFSVEVSAAENLESVLESHGLATESPVSVPAEMQEDVSDAGMADLSETKSTDKATEQGNTSNDSAEESDNSGNESKHSTDRFVVSENASDLATNGENHGNTSVAAGSVSDSGHIKSASYSITSNAARAASDYLDLGSCGANLTWVLDNNGCLSITGEGDMTNYADVSAIPWFSYRSLITKVSFSGNITNIGAYAFDYCVNLTSITIPDSVINIGAYSFYGCSGFRSIAIPKNVTGIGAYAFSGCTGLTSVTISDNVTSIGASAFAGCTSLANITIPESVTSIGDDAFDNTGIDTSEIAFRRGSCGTSLKWALLGNHQLRIYGTGAMTDFSAGSAPWYNEREKIQEIILSDGVTGIGDYALEGCKTLTTITLADTVTTIGKYAFAQCTGVSEIDLASITEIAEHAFEKSGLTEVRISGGGTVTIGNDAFSGCVSLKNVTLEQCTLNTGDRIWQGCTGLETVTISAGFTEMGSSLFAGCTSLSQVSLAGNCSVVGSYLFDGCTALTEITIPEGVAELGSYAFQNCSGITEITLPDSVTAIQSGVFSGCSNLKQIQFSKHLETIGDNAFKNCTQFTSMVIPDSVTGMGSGVFSGCKKLESLTLPFVGSQKEPEEASQETLFGYVFGTASYTEATAVKQYYSDSGYSTFYLPESLVSVTVTGGKLLYGAFDHCAALEQITIPDTITSIDSYVFRECRGLKEFAIENGVTELGSYAFQNCIGITEITFPDSLMAIETGAFSGCSGLASILLPDQLQSIGSGAFSDCTALEAVKLPKNITQIESNTFKGCTLLQNITIPEQVESIGEEAFRGCTAMEDISLPANLIELGTGVFRDCSELQRINLPAGISDISDYIFFGCAALQQIVIAGEVTKIGNYSFAKCAVLEEVPMPDTLTEIGNYAFSGCAAVQNIKLPQELTQIGSYAFQDCVGLTEMAVPDNMQTIGSGAFSGCSRLEHLSIPFVGGSADVESASASTLFGYIFGTASYTGGTAAKQYYSNTGYATYYIPDALTEVEIAGGKIWFGSFYGCSYLESIQFLSTELITDIGTKAFYGCAGLTHLTVPDGVQTIGDYAFSGCTALINLSQMDDLETIGSYAFQNCSSLKSISLPKTVTTINTAAFSGCSSLESMTLPFVGSSAGQVTASKTSLFGVIFGTTSYTGGVATKQYYSSGGSATYYLPASLRTVTVTDGAILYGAFYNCTSITHLSLPESLPEIGNYAFYNCTGIIHLRLPENLTEIGDYTFYNCTGIMDLALSKDITKIGKYAFVGCSSLKEMVVPASVTSIGSYAFQNCTALQDISILGKVTSIESYLFSGCTALENIIIPNGVTSIGTYAFQNCSSITDITVPDSVTEIGSAAFSGCGSLQSMTLPFVGYSSSQTTASTKSLFGYIFGTTSYTGGTAVKQMYSSSSSTYYIPATLTEVRITGGALLYGAFYGCSNLTHLTLPENLTEVGKYAFYQCSGLKEISLPAGVVSIGSYAFAGCYALKEFTFPPKVSSIESYTFSGCTAMDQITIPDSITEIGTGAFQNCSQLTSMIVPDSVTAIGSAAFSGCSGLQSMTLPFAGYSASASAASSKSLFGYIFGTAAYTGGVATRQYYSSSGSGTYYIPASLKNVVITGGSQIYYGTFYGCSGLNGITLPGTITSIGQKAFYQCTALSEITIPQYVTTLAANAFAGCTGMKYVTFSGKAPGTITATAFTGVTATVFYPISDTSWNDIIGNQYGGTLTWQPHTHSYQPVVTAPTCTEQGYTTYQCTHCNSSYTGDYVNALGHVSVIDPAVQATCTSTGLTEGSHCSVCGEVIIAQMTTQKAGHRFTEYVSNQDATYEQDGTMTAKCNLCQATETITDPGSKLIDENKPTVEITVGTNHWTGFFHAITFGLFFKNSQTATIQAVDEEKLLDGSMVDRLDSVYYYLSDTEIKSQDLELVAWQKYTNTLSLDPDKKYIVYAKAVDRSKNTTYASSTGMIVDHTGPVMDGISDGQTYCEKAVFTVSDLSLRSVTDNGVAMETANGLYTITGDDQPHRIIATDDCGNTTEVTIMVTRHHDWKEPVFLWSDGHKSCIAEYTCSRNSSHVVQVDCMVQSQSPDATCTKAGNVIYTATAVLDGVVKTDMQTVSGTALGHDYIPEFVWSADHSTCAVTLTCQRAGCSENTAGHILGSLPCMVKTRTTAATCISPGKKEVVASLVVEGVEYTDVCSTEVIPVDPDNHVHTKTFNQREATCLTAGATGDVYCLDCNKIVEESTATDQLAHVWDDGQIIKAATCSEKGILLRTCTNGCGTVWEIEIPIDSEHHGALRIVGAREATATEAGYTGDTYCDDCKRIVVYGSVIPATGNIGGTDSPSPIPGSTEKPSPMPGSTENPTIIPGGTENPLPIPGNTGSPVPAPGSSAGSSSGNANGKTSFSSNTKSMASSSGSASAVLKKGTVFVSGKLKYKVTNAANGKFTVAVQAPKSKTVKSLTIPATVKIQGQSYQVTSIAASAFQKCSKLKKITIGKNITVIGKKAFYQAKTLKQITILSTKITSVGKNAWKGIYKKAVIQVPKKKRTTYQKLFRNKGQKKTVRIK